MKNNKKGISLIVLVITIIVIIILAAAVILTLNNNNPIAEANEARYRSDLANMQAILTNTVAKIMAANQAVIEIHEKTNIAKVGKESETVDKPGFKNSAENQISYKLTDASVSTNASGVIQFSAGDNKNATTTWYTGRALPSYPAGDKTIWNVTAEGNLTLKVGTDGSVFDSTK